jgi:hypothetical protein
VQFNAVFISIAPKYSLKFDIMIPLTLLFLLYIALAIHNLLNFQMNVGKIFQSMWWMSLGFWRELQWTCGLLLVI